MPHSRLTPKLLTVIREGYSFEKFLNDLIAGIIVGIVALPLAIAFGIASGVNPSQGIITAIVAGFLISALGGSRVQIGGPTGAFIVIVYGIVQKYGYDGLATATLIAGILLILMGVFRLGSIIKFIPYPVTIGFTSGIALIIFTTQIKDFFGLTISNMPGDFLKTCELYYQQFQTINYRALLIGLFSLLIIIYWPRLTKRIPGSLVAIVVMTVIVQFFDLPLQTIGSKFGNVLSTLPKPHLPSISFPLVKEMFQPAFAIAMLAAIESLLSAVVADGMTGRRHRSNMELVAQGIANIVSPIFGGIPATGAIARTATNIKNGGTTPIAGIIHALTLVLIVLFVGPWVSYIPMATLAAILIMVSYHMSEWHLFVKMFRGPKNDIIVMLATFSLTVFVDLIVAIEVGVVLAAMLFMHRMAEVTHSRFITKELEDEESEESSIIQKQKRIPPGIEIFEINGPFFFGAADKFKDAISQAEHKPKVLILRMRHVPSMDATGVRALEDLFDRTKKDGTSLLLSGILTEPKTILEKAGLLKKIGIENIHSNFDQALNHAKKFLELER